MSNTFGTKKEVNTVQRDGRLARLVLLVFTSLVLLLLLNNYWHGDYGLEASQQITRELNNQNAQNALQARKNAILAADIKDLKTGLTATEEHARLDLGLIKAGETFVQLSTAPVVYSNAPQASNEPDAVEVVDPLFHDEGTVP